METPITKHPEFEKEGQRHLELFEGTILDAREMFDAGGEAAQAILQPEINRLRESNAELLTALTRLYNAMDSCIEITPELMQSTRAIMKKQPAALRLAEGPNK